MSDTAEMTMQQYREFEVFFLATEQVDGSWRVHVQVYFGRVHIDQLNLASNYPTKHAAEMAGYGYGCASVERWLAKLEYKLKPDRTEILVGGWLYNFPTAEEAADAIRWLMENNASPEEFASRYAQYQSSEIPRSSKLSL